MNPAYFETRFRLSEPPPAWPQEFVIISAYATTGQAWTASDNEAADHRLASELGNGKGWLVRIVGYSPTSGHAEPSWAVALSLDEGCALGGTYRQDAIYHIKNDALSVRCCGPSGEFARIGSFRQRLDVANLR
jgi:hypothetical protein